MNSAATVMLRLSGYVQDRGRSFYETMHTTDCKMVTNDETYVYEYHATGLISFNFQHTESPPLLGGGEYVCQLFCLEE